MPVAALHWLRARIGAPGSGRGGNVVVLRASGERDYTDAFFRDGNFAWVQEIRVPHCAGEAELAAVAAYVERADAVFFAGGDQANYVRWKGSSLVRAVRALYARGGFVGGGSAGVAIQGAVVYDAVAADRLLPEDANVGSADAVRTPLEPAISFTTDLFAWPPLRALESLAASARASLARLFWVGSWRRAQAPERARARFLGPVRSPVAAEQPASPRSRLRSALAPASRTETR